MFRHAVAIGAQDTDAMGHVNNSVYLRWVQDAVVEYWEKVAPAEAVASHLWVALKHEITYRRPTFLEDVVVAEVLAGPPHTIEGDRVRRLPVPERRPALGYSAHRPFQMEHRYV